MGTVYLSAWIILREIKKVDGQFNAYENLYYSQHLFNGYMDYFTWIGDQGLVDLMLKGDLHPVKDWKVGIDFHYFESAQEYKDYTGGYSKDIGFEIDAGVSTKKIKGLDLSAGVSLFLPSESYAGKSDPDPGYWMYAMITAGF